MSAVHHYFTHILTTQTRFFFLYRSKPQHNTFVCVVHAFPPVIFFQIHEAYIRSRALHIIYFYKCISRASIDLYIIYVLYTRYILIPDCDTYRSAEDEKNTPHSPLVVHQSIIRAVHGEVLPQLVEPKSEGIVQGRVASVLQKKGVGRIRGWDVGD